MGDKLHSRLKASFLLSWLCGGVAGSPRGLLLSCGGLAGGRLLEGEVALEEGFEAFKLEHKGNMTPRIEP